MGPGGGGRAGGADGGACRYFLGSRSVVACCLGFGIRRRRRHDDGAQPTDEGRAQARRGMRGHPGIHGWLAGEVRERTRPGAGDALWRRAAGWDHSLPNCEQFSLFGCNLCAFATTLLSRWHGTRRTGIKKRARGPVDGRCGVLVVGAACFSLVVVESASYAVFVGRLGDGGLSLLRSSATAGNSAGRSWRSARSGFPGSRCALRCRPGSSAGCRARHSRARFRSGRCQP